jgi:predicted dehydrogenase
MLIAVLGCGSIGRRHLRNLLGLGYTNLVAFDPVLRTRQETTAEMKIPVAAALAEVWQQGPQAVIIAAPTDLHIPIALEAARANCDLFIEKPLSHSLEGIEELLQVVAARNLITMVGCNMRFHPGPAAVNRLLADEAIGRVIAARIQTGSYLPRWRPWQDYHQSYSASKEGGGAILDCIHEIDLALWYFGPAQVAGSAWLAAETLGLDTDGLAEILLKHENGVLSNVHLNFVQRDYWRTCQIIGTEGTIYWNFGDQRVLVMGPEGQMNQEIPQPAGWQVNQMYVDELSHFLQCVDRRKSTVNPISSGLSALQIALEVRHGMN